MCGPHEFKVKVDGEAISTVRYSGWLRRRTIVEYDISQIPQRLKRGTFSILEAHVIERLKKRPFEFHIHFHAPG